MNQDDPVHRGYLQFSPAKKLTKKWQHKYCLLFKSSKSGIQRLEIYEHSNSEKSTESKIITLENCIKISPRTDKQFIVVTKSGTYEFAANTYEEMQEWLSALQAVAFPDNSSKQTSIEEDNDLYCSAGEEIFNVKIHSSPASIRCGLDSINYTLVLTPSAIELYSADGKNLLYNWPYCFIRRYGYKNGKFTFEAGRKCESGEGIFFLEYPKQQEIFRCVATKMKNFKQLMTAESTSSLLESDHLQAALSMEARSRSPFPPSFSEKDPNTSIRSQISLHDSKITKIHPPKPPRKTLGYKKTPDGYPDSCSSNSTMSDYEPIEGYDKVEQRNEAWKTLGIEEVAHKEQLNNNETEEYMSWGQMKQAIATIETKQKGPKIITESPGENSYDKLNFFGSSSKLSIKSGYNQVVPPPIVPVVSPPSFNEYDEVLVQSDISPARSADDSHLGYAVVRKDFLKEEMSKKNMRHITPRTDEPIMHSFKNNEPYAVISKPKRV